MKLNTTNRLGRCLNLLTIALCAAAVSWSVNVASASPFKLQGKSAGSSDWLSGNLEGWHELDYIPCRLYISSGPVLNQIVTIKFPRTNGVNPGFETLTNFTVSPNVEVIDGPTLSAPPTGDWSYSLKINVTNCEPAEILFSARLADGSSANPGSSLMLSGSPASMGRLQIHKPAPAEVTPNQPPKTLPLLRIRLTSTNTVMLYWPSPSDGWTLQENCPMGSTNWTDMNVTPGDDGQSRFILLDKPPGSCGYRLVYH